MQLKNSTSGILLYNVLWTNWSSYNLRCVKLWQNNKSRFIEQVPRLALCQSLYVIGLICFVYAASPKSSKSVFPTYITHLHFARYRMWLQFKILFFQSRK
jgi:hypothetical protein